MVKTTKVLITGISGLLGSTYARYLIIKGGYEVIGIDNMIGGVEGNVPEKATIFVEIFKIQLYLQNYVRE